MKKVILFDLDDTLAPEDLFIRSGYRAVAAYLTESLRLDEVMNRDFRTVSAEIAVRLYELYTQDSTNVFNRLLDEMQIDYTMDYIKVLVGVYREHDIDTDIYDYYDDVRKNLNALKNMGCKLGIISDGYKVSQRNKVKKLKADKLFDKIIITDELGRDYWKPDERSFVMMMGAFDVDWDDMVYVGDNPKKDFLIGLNHPIVTVRIMRENSVYLNAEYLEDTKEKFRISSFDELPDIAKRV